VVLAALLLVVLGTPVLIARAWSVEVAGDRPNVLVVLIDTLRADRLGAYGYERDTSPHIDRLASEGWTFNAAIAQASWTKPSIASIFTGLYAGQTSVNPGTWAHEGEAGAIAVQALAAEHLTLAERMAAAGFETAAFGHNHHLVPKLGFSQGFLTYDWEVTGTYRLGPFSKLAKRFLRPEFAAQWINPNFLKWLDSNEDRRFFAYLHHIDVHWPYRSPEPFAGMYASVESADDFNKPDYWNETTKGLNLGDGTSVDPRTLLAMNDAYDEGIRFVDDGLGQVFDELRRRGLYDNTLIIVTSDHGEEFLEHGSLAHGHSLYDELIRVPLIVKFPCPGPYCAPRVVDSQVELVDIFPTVMAAIGEAPHAELVGKDLAQADDGERNAYSEHSAMIALRTPEWKWIYKPPEDSGELYHLPKDPGEITDLAADESELARSFTTQVLDFTVTHQKLVGDEGTLVEADEKMLENLKALGYIR
jgi:arylsulfatase A-like enzyme